MNGGSPPADPQGEDPGQEPRPGSGRQPSWPPQAPPAGGYGTFPQAPPPDHGPPPSGQPYGQPAGWAGYGMPAPGYGTPAGQPPTYLVWGILAAIGGVLFCLIGGVPTAIVAIVNANKVKTKWSAGDHAGALQASKTARTWAIVSTVLDVIGVIIVVIFIAAGMRSGSGTTAGT